MLAQAIGPVFGGILTQYLGFHSIFWALFIFGAITLFLILVFLPETLRSIAGNGSVRLQGTHKPLIYIFKGQPGVVDDSHFKHTKERVSIRMFFEPLKFLFEKDVFVTLFFGSIV
jgi:MFS family permease